MIRWLYYITPLSLSLSTQYIYIYIYISSPAIPDHNITSISTYTHPIPQSQFQPPLRKQHAIPHLTLAISDIGFGSSLTETDMYVYGWHGYCIWQNEQSGSQAVKQSAPIIHLPTYSSIATLIAPLQPRIKRFKYHIASHHSKPPKPTRYLPLSHPIPPCKHNFPYYLDKTKQPKPNQIYNQPRSHIYIYIYTIFNFLLR